jgi:hypothetical protein
MDVTLNTITNVAFSDEIGYSFALNNSDNNTIVLRTKNYVEILRLSNDFSNNELKFQLSTKKIKVSEKIPVLSKNDLKIYDDSNFLEKQDLMLDPYKITDCTLKNIHFKKVFGSPLCTDMKYKVACLTTAGFIELHTYFMQYNKIESIEVNLNDLVKEAIANFPKEITKYSVLEKCTKSIAFSNFEWVIYENSEYLLVTTKSDDIFAFKLLENNNVTIEFQGSIDKISDGVVKWINHKGKNFLIVTTKDGDYKRFSIEIEDKIVDIKEIDIIKGQLEMPVTNIFADSSDDSLILLSIKSHSLEVLSINDRKINILLKYIDLCITGVTKTDEMEYLLCTLNSKIYMVRLDTINGSLVMKEYGLINIESNDNVQLVPKYSFHGIATSKNKILVYICGYPQMVSAVNIDNNFKLNIH